jgi:alpha-tubulin suppressor-like RCC1 family protein
VALVAVLAAAVPVSLSASSGAAAAVRPSHSPTPVVVSLGTSVRVTSIAVGHADGCAILVSARAECWGDNFYGQLGDGTTRTSPRPVAVRGLTGVFQVGIGLGHTCALVRSATVRCWGWNQSGQLGDVSRRSATLPQLVAGLHGVRAISVGFAHSCALLVNGTVRCWGWNQAGQLGDGTTSSRWVPVGVAGLRDATQVAAGYATTCALLRSRHVACWGANASGELGDGATRGTLHPVLVHGLGGVRSISVGFASACAVLLTGRVECWGKNNYGQLGDGTLRSTPVPTMTKRLSGVAQASLGFGHTCAVLTSGTIRCWGWNGHGQLGTGTTTSALEPVPSVTLSHVRQLAAGDDNTCALLSLGFVSCWGWNNDGQLGVGTTVELKRPPFAPTAPSASVTQVGDATVRVTWLAPRSAGVAGITGYTAVATDASSTLRGGQRCTWSSGPLACSLTGLTNGDTYTFAVDAHNAVGRGPWSPPTAPVVPATTPEAPLDVVAAPANHGAVVTWSAPAFDGGRAVTRYVVTATDQVHAANGGQTCTWSGGPLTCSVTGLTNGDGYVFSVTARNDLGTSAPSLHSSAIVPAAVPNAPGNVQATPGNTAATVTWSAPASNGSAITKYTITAHDATSAARGGQTCTWTTGLLTCIVTGLTNGDSYTFSVAATNAAGLGPSGASVAITPATGPGSPTGVTAAGGQGQALVSWSAPADDGGLAVSSYGVTAADATSAARGGQSCSWTTGDGALSCSVTGLTNGDSYTFTVTASNGAGTSGASAPSNAIVPMAPPNAPISVHATAQDAKAVLTWLSGGANGSTITSYLATATDQTNAGNGGQTCSWVTGDGALTCTVNGLTNGDSYTFTMTATNGVGTSAASGASNAVVPATVPDAPSGASATAEVGSASVSWSAPGSNGGSTITDYTVTAADQTNGANGGQTCDWANGPLTCTVDGLTPGDAYTFTVTATNKAGTGAPSSASNQVTIPTVPDAPTSVLGVADVASAEVSWSAPDTDGGSAITTYTVTATDQTNGANGGETCTWTTGDGILTCTVGGLTSGDSYTFTVTATNAVGTSTPSDPSPVVIPL